MEARMAVTVTLIFSDESHREAWLIEQGIIGPGPIPPKNEAGEYLIDQVAPERGPKRSALLRRIDYWRRRENTDLQYTIGPITLRHRSEPVPHTPGCTGGDLCPVHGTHDNSD